MVDRSLPYRAGNPAALPNLSDAILSNTTLNRANLSRVNLSRATLSDSNLNRANLSGANLSGANLSYANLSGANLNHAVLIDADLSQAKINQDTNFGGVMVNGNTKGIGPWIFNPDKYIIREIEFLPEYRQAGIGIMNYFAEVMCQKYPDIPATIQITQKELTVRMTIETDSGHREIIEKTLEEYGLVVSGQWQPSELLPDPVAIMGLQHKLDMAEMEVRHANHQLQLAYKQNQLIQAQNERLEARLNEFQLLMGEHLRHANRLVDVLEFEAFAPLRPLLVRGLTEADKADVQRMLTEAGQQNPRLLQRLAEQITSGAIGGTIGGASVELLKPWLQEVANHLGIVIRLAF